MGIKETIDRAKAERVIYEYRYKKNPESVARLINKLFVGQKIVIFPDTKHSFDVSTLIDEELVKFEIVGRDKIVDVEKSSYVILIGYWNKQGLNDFCSEFAFPIENIFLPYAHESIVCESKNIDNEIDSLEFGCSKKPELVVVIYHEARDFITQSAFEISKYFRLTKIYLQDMGSSSENIYFDQVIALKGEIKALEYFFYKHYKFIDICSVFAHGHDFWKCAYIKTLISKETKLITLSCDWNGAYEDRDVLVEASGYTLIDTYEDEKLALEISDAVVSNMHSKVLEASGKFLSSYAFMNYNKFQYIEKSTLNFTSCYAGSVMLANFDTHYGRPQDIRKIFYELIRYGISLDIYGNYNININESFFDANCHAGSINVRGTLEHEKLPDALKNYDFGIAVYNLDKDTGQSILDIFGDIIQAKIITYLSAGIPVVINRELRKTSELLEKFNCGLAIDSSEIKNIGKIICQADYLALKKGVKAFQDAYKTENPALKLANFLLDIYNNSKNVNL